MSRRKKHGHRKDSHKPNAEHGIKAMEIRGKQVSRKTPYL